MNQVDFESKSLTGNILKIALPMLLAEMVNLLYSVIDRIYIGRIPNEGSLALSGIGLSFPLIVIITGFSNMYGMGGSPLYSIELGKKNKEKARQILNISFCLIVITAILIMAAGELFAKSLLNLFGANEVTMKYAYPYLRIYLAGTIWCMIASGMNPFLNAKGYPIEAMLSVMTGAIMNLILDPIFIFKLKMGVEGAALATILAQTASAMVTIWFLHKKLRELSLKGIGKKQLRDVWDIISLGTAPFIMSCTNSFVQISCNSVLMKCGGELYVSVMTIILSVRQIVDTPVMAFTNGASPILSYNYGCQKKENIWKTIKIMSIITVSYTAVIWMIIFLKPQVFIAIFTADQELLEKAVPALHLYFLAFVFQALQGSGQAVFKSLNMKKHAIFFSLLRKVILVVPLTYALPVVFKMGTNGVFLAEPVSNMLGGVACFTTMLLSVYIRMKDMPDQKRNGV